MRTIILSGSFCTSGNIKADSAGTELHEVRKMELRKMDIEKLKYIKCATENTRNAQV